VFASGLTVNLPGGILTSSGTLAPAGIGVVGTTAMTGTFRLPTVGTLAIDLDLGLNTADLLAITGQATLAGTVLVNPIDTATVKPGDNVVTFLTVTGQLNPTGLVIKPTSALVTVSLDFVNAHTIAIDYGVDYSPDSFGLSGNRYTVGQALDAIQAAGASPLFQSIAPKFFAIPSDAQLGRLYDHLSGEGSSGAQQAAFFADDQFLRATTDALAAPRGGDGWDATGTRLWAQAYGGGGALEGRAADNSNNLSYGGGGLAAGAQHALGEHAVVGAALATDTTSFSAHVAAFGAVRAGGLYALVVGGGDFFTLDSDRSFTALGDAELIRGRTHLRSLSLRTEAGYEFGLGAVDLTPFIGVQTSSLKTNAYGETTVAGPDLFALDFADHRTHSTLSTVGVQLNPDTATVSRVRPYLRLEWRHEFQPDRGVTAEFADFAGAQSYDVIGAPAARNLARAEAGIDWTIARRASLFIGVNGEVGGGEADGGGHAGVRWTW
jgi:outer membrane autotransporter protein